LIYGKLSLDIFLLILVTASFFTVSNTFFQNQYQLVYSQQQTTITNNSNYSSKNEISNALLEQFKEIVFKQLSSNSSSLVGDYIGWTVTTDFGKEVLSHTGSIDGYTSIIGFNPSKQIGFVILWLRI
jgi:hypothetical protein